MSSSCKIISIYNMKGGVGKTTVAVNLSYASSLSNSKILLIDLDSQGSASYYFRVRLNNKFKAKTFLKSNEKVEKEIKASDFENLDILPSGMSFRNIDFHLNDQNKSKKVIAKVLEPLKSNYDFIFIDCPPNLTILTENIFNASDIVLLPLIPTTLSVNAYRKVFEFFHKRDADLSKFLAFFSMVEKRKKMHKEIMSDLLKNDSYFLKNYIPYASEIEKMGVMRSPVLHFNRGSFASHSFLKLWDEILNYIL